MNPSAETKAVGIAFGGQASQPGKVLPGYQKFYRQDNTNANTPCPRFPASSRKAGVFFDRARNFFVWQFPYRGYSPRGGISDEVLS